MPGYVVGVLTIDKMGRRNMQLMGFFMMGVMYIIIAAGFAPIKAAAVDILMVIYGVYRNVITSGSRRSLFNVFRFLFLLLQLWAQHDDVRHTS